MKIEIEANELIQITKELNNAMFEKIKLIADNYEEDLRIITDNYEDQLKKEEK